MHLSTKKLKKIFPLIHFLNDLLLHETKKEFETIAIIRKNSVNIKPCLYSADIKLLKLE